MAIATITARVYLIRHGETDENRRKIVQGQMDTALNAFGREQGGLVAGALRSVPFAAAFSSDLVRASKTAKMILAHHPKVWLQEQEELRERVREKTPLFLGKDSAYMRNQPEDDSVESGPRFANRAVQWWNKMILQQARGRSPSSSLITSSDKHVPQHILVVTHGGFISVLLRELIGSRKVRCAEDVVIGKCLNSSVTIIDVDETGKGVVVQFSDTSHLTQKAVEENADDVKSKC